MSDTSISTEKTGDAQAMRMSADEKHKKEQKPATVFGIPMPGFITSIGQSITGGLHSLRMFALKHTSRHIINNSSNILGFTHVLTEMMMFKASNKDGKLINNPENPVNWVWEPFKNVFADTFKRSHAGTTSVKEMLKGNPFKNFYQYVTDVDAATARVRSAPENAGKALNEIRFGNSWVARSTLIGLTMWSLSTMIPEKKESPEEIERMAIKRRNNPIAYVGERLKQALWIPDWRTHKRQMLGLGNIMLGITSAVGAWRGRTENPITRIQKYSFNGSYLGTAIVSMLAGLPLLFASDEQRGYGGFGSIMMLRIPFLFGSIKTKFNPKGPEPGRYWYLGSSVSFQAENLSQALIGGAEKKEDGTIVDHTAIREEARQKANEARKNRSPRDAAEPSDVPSTTVSSVSAREAAMPQQAPDKQQASAALAT